VTPANRQQFLTLAAIAVVGFYACDRLLVTPLLKAWRTRAQQLTELRAAVARGELLLERADSIRERWDLMRSNTLPRQSSVAENQLLGAFERWSRESGVGISAIRPQWKRLSDQHTVLECRADAFGPVSSLSRFLYQLEKDPLALRVDSLDLTARDNDGSQLNLTLQVSALLLTPGGS
jgi:hypothetical protein